VFVTGLGLPSELAGHVRSGAVDTFAIWNPIDLGYGATMLAYDIASGKKAEPGASLPVGRLGSVKLDEHGDGSLGALTIYNASNIDEAAKLF